MISFVSPLLNAGCIRLATIVSAFVLFAGVSFAGIQTSVGYHAEGQESPSFAFTNVPSPSRSDAAAMARFTIVTGEADASGGGLEKLHDGKVPTEADEPAENFFFGAGSMGGRIQADLGRTCEIKQVNTYSWHPASRGPQVYKLYASDGTVNDFNAQPGKDTDLKKVGWKLIAAIDTRTQGVEGGGQYGVSISDSTGVIGRYRYLLFDISPTETDDAFGNTFYSEMDVVELNAPVESAVVATMAPLIIASADGYGEITIDTSKAPELKAWAEQKLAPELAEWYPKIIAMMPSEGFSAPKKFSVMIAPGEGVASTSGTRINANSDWLKGELNGEAVGALIHEVVHVVQQYNGGWQNVPKGNRAPGWLTEGIPDYIRFFKFEPQSHGADNIWLKSRRNVVLKYDGMYRISANFLDYVVEHYDPKKTLILKVNAACRQGVYTDGLWLELTGKPLAELNTEWKASVRQQLATKTDPDTNVLTAAEQAAGWKLLFDGQSFTGWHNFKSAGVRPGWQVKDGVLVCVDPHNAGDLVTTEKFGAFELQLDYNISEGGNSGIIYHVTDEGGAVWATGPEFQLEDNAKAVDLQRCGWLYGLYQPPLDPKTGQTLDATKPVGEWNHIRLVISPEQCVHEINGVKYFEYVIGSADFNARVAKSKFGKMPLFAKAATGYLALQGDHGQVSFRNIKIRPLAAGPDSGMQNRK